MLDERSTMRIEAALGMVLRCHSANNKTQTLVSGRAVTELEYKDMHNWSRRRLCSTCSLILTLISFLTSIDVRTPIHAIWHCYNYKLPLPK